MAAASPPPTARAVSCATPRRGPKPVEILLFWRRLLGNQHPSPNVKNPLRVRAAIWLKKLSQHVMPKVLVLKAQGRHVMWYFLAFLGHCFLGARLRGRTATQRSKKGSEKVLGRVLGKGSQKGSEKGACYGFQSKKGFWEGVLRRGVSRRCLEHPFGEYAPLGVHPIFARKDRITWWMLPAELRGYMGLATWECLQFPSITQYGAEPLRGCELGAWPSKMTRQLSLRFRAPAREIQIPSRNSLKITPWHETNT